LLEIIYFELISFSTLLSKIFETKYERISQAKTFSKPSVFLIQLTLNFPKYLEKVSADFKVKHFCLLFCKDFFYNFLLVNLEENLDETSSPFFHMKYFQKREGPKSYFYSDGTLKIPQLTSTGKS